ncbi:Bifunctional sugar kinase/adenylyltransferase [Melioribacter roseus P3M-2]|uniref:D-glycero-beta-D-manno-heptose 1-phosphate adenylyltransferase n=1 Tax=Melioribacter roseus (strain DSM 23840 / JCM 17771 / VKM B-2668 / P3M-2) TaxID=1191523 RepID=I7A1L0_MELRP|nr:D-glycero-beta-D-manno-heptose 1-phosphate adenylyltransferase [Melioribacter roseus]AFN75108.1 Bifunctional sugar kinase/adenylyltransferase [Melioribacter roseus P3M-2]
MNAILSQEELIKIREQLAAQNKKVVFTNGCFDIIHAGHIDYLIKAKQLGDILIVAVNSDESVRRIKGEKRPILKQEERTFIISNLKPVDYVTVFEEDTPYEIIKKLVPDILVKGADWSKDKIVGADIVENNGGAVETIEFVNIQSTSNIINTILDRYK